MPRRRNPGAISIFYRRCDEWETVSQEIATGASALTMTRNFRTLEIILAIFAPICYYSKRYKKAMIGSPCTDKHSFSECGMVGAAWVQYRAFPRELPSEKYSRNGRVTALTVTGVIAPKSAP